MFPSRALKGLTQSLRGSTTIIGAEAFHSYCRRNGPILSPVTLLQNKLRCLVLGKEFWKRQTRNRVEICDGKYIPFSRLLQQINEGKRDRARRASLLELTLQLTHQLAHQAPLPPSAPPHEDSSLSPSASTSQVMSPSQSMLSRLFPCWRSSQRTHPELTSTLPMESGQTSWRISLTDQQSQQQLRPLPLVHEVNSENQTESESILNRNYSRSRSKSGVFEPEEPLYVPTSLSLDLSRLVCSPLFVSFL
jgi:hypothetical protein